MATFSVTDYPKEVLKWMQMKEDQHPPYRKLSPQLSVRGSLVDFIRQVCEALQLSVLTTHLGIHLLDRFMDVHNICNNQLRLSALTVIFLAAKFEEKDSNIPKIPQLNAFARNRYSLNIFNRMEIFMLKFFEWNIGTVTPAHFVEFFLMYGITPEDFSDCEEDLSSPVIHRKLWYSTQHYLDISLQDTEFLQWKSSQVAAACVVCGRIQTLLLPTWPYSLETATGYSLNSLSPLTDTLLRLSELEERIEDCRTPESGYRSGSSSLQASPATPQNYASSCT